jgi:hypothetical protein
MKITGLFLLSFFTLLTASAFWQTGCNTTDPPLELALKLELEDVSCTEAWITLTTTNLQLPAEINLIRTDAGGNIVSHISILNTQDSLFYIDSLHPNQTYKFHSVIQPFNQSSNEITVTTLDTTSHNYVWQVFEFGNIGNSILFDVAIVGSEIWTVGEINIADTSEIGYTRYNAVHWDGNEWNLQRIMFYTICRQQSSQNAYPASSIIAFSEDEIWVAQRGDQIAKLENGIQTQTICMPWTFQINKIWGTSSNDLYVVGNNGNIAHYNGSQWRRIESGTDVDLKDVWGTPDGKLVWVSGKVDLSKSVLIKIEGGQANIVFEDHYPWQIQEERISGGISSIWTHSKNFIYATTPLTVYRCLSNTSGEGKEIYPYDDYLNGGTVRIRGTAINNIITSGSNSSILHFNGVSWKRFEELTDEAIYLWSSDIKNGTIVSVGDKFEGIFDYKAIAVVGKK